MVHLHFAKASLRQFDEQTQKKKFHFPISLSPDCIEYQPARRPALPAVCQVSKCSAFIPTATKLNEHETRRAVGCEHFTNPVEIAPKNLFGQNTESERASEWGYLHRSCSPMGTYWFFVFSLFCSFFVMGSIILLKSVGPDVRWFDSATGFVRRWRGGAMVCAFSCFQIAYKLVHMEIVSICVLFRCKNCSAAAPKRLNILARAPHISSSIMYLCRRQRWQRGKLKSGEKGQIVRRKNCCRKCSQFAHYVQWCGQYHAAGNVKRNALSQKCETKKISFDSVLFFSFHFFPFFFNFVFWLWRMKDICCRFQVPGCIVFYRTVDFPSQRRPSIVLLHWPMHTQSESRAQKSHQCSLFAYKLVGAEPLITPNDKMMAKIARYASSGCAPETEHGKIRKDNAIEAWSTTWRCSGIGVPKWRRKSHENKESLREPGTGMWGERGSVR